MRTDTVPPPAAPRLLGWFRGLRMDIGLAVVATLIGVGGTSYVARYQSDVRSLDALGYLLLLVGPAVLLVRRRWPAAGYGVVFAANLTYDVLNYPHGPLWIPLIVTFITTLTSGHRVLAYLSLPIGYVLFLELGHLVNGRPLPSLPAAVGIAAWMACLPAVTELVRNRRAYRLANELRQAEERRSAEREARRQAMEERLGIARELHDVLAHSISMINVQAGVALELMDDDPRQTREALTAIKRASKDALVEVQSVLGALRQPGETAPRQPTATLSSIDVLVSQAKATGLEVAVRSAADLASLPATVDATGYRIVQEALTNVVRHANANSVRIVLRRTGSSLVVRVEDNGAGQSAGQVPVPGGGHGLTGMRERVAALGGRLDAAPMPGGGFAVRAELPLTESVRMSR